jgi:hypothetical protein
MQKVMQDELYGSVKNHEESSTDGGFRATAEAFI